MKRNLLLLSIILIGLTSCEDMVTEIDLPASESHYVIHAYLSPEDTAVTVFIGQSDPVFGDEADDTSWVAQAHVFINGYELPRVQGMAEYCFSVPIDSFSIIPGNSYTVSLHIGAEEVCYGSCTVPLLRNESLTFDGIDSVQVDQYDGMSSYEYYAHYSFNDAAGEENFYRIGADITFFDPYSSETYTYRKYLTAEDFFKDVLFNGEEYSGRLSLGYIESLSNLSALKLTLYTSDSYYYYYHRAILSEGGDDPFSEPVIVPSNIENGLGCVAGYRKYSITAL